MPLTGGDSGDRPVPRAGRTGSGLSIRYIGFLRSALLPSGV